VDYLCGCLRVASGSYPPRNRLLLFRKAQKTSAGDFVLVNSDAREGTGVRAACHVFLLTGLCVAGQEHAGCAVGEEDRNRVVVGLGEELA
jgi:hypothetical protein